jgi:WD40 repeat protein
LRTLLILAPLVAIAAAIGFRYWYADYLQRRAIAAVTKLGGTVVWDEKQERVIGVELPGREIDDARLRELVPHLKNLPQLQTLMLISNQVGDEGIQPLAELPNLQIVYLADTKVTKEGIAKLQRQRPQLTIDVSTPNPRATRLARRDIYEHAILSLAMSASGEIVGGSGDGQVRVWEAASGEMRAALAAHEEWTFALAFHPGGQWLATGGGDNLVKLWDWETWTEIGRFTGHTDDVHAIAFTPDGRTLASTGDDKTVRLWDVATRRQLHCLRGHTRTIPGLAISADGTLAASASRDGTVRLWDIAAGQPRSTLSGHSADVLSVAFHPGGRELASASYDGRVIVWDLAEQRPRARLAGHKDWVFGVRYSPDGLALVSTAGDGVCIWDAATGALHWHSRSQRNVSSALWLSGSELATSSADGSIAIWTSPGDRVATLWTRFTPEALRRRDQVAE